MEGRRLTIRLTALAALVAVLLVTMGGRLMNMQLVNAETWTDTAEVYLASRDVPVQAVRGEILDRYGRPLVSNSTRFDVVIDYTELMASGDPAQTVLALIYAAQETGHAYEDSFPVSQAPYRYTEPSDEDLRRLGNYLEKNGWAADCTAEELMAHIQEKFNIRDRYSAYQARLVAGVLYEVDMRYTASAYPAPYIYVPAYTFARDTDMALASRIAEESLRGVSVSTVSERSYQTDAAAHFLGSVGQIYAADYEHYTQLGYAADELVGRDGVEKAFESWLHGTAGTLTQKIDETGRVYEQTVTREAQAGKNVLLTIDIRFQEEVEQLLAAGVRNLQETGTKLKGRESEAAAAVVLDVTNGEVLALANYPSYSLLSFAEDYAALLEDPLTPLVNRAIAGTYSPGSTFKMAVSVAGLETGVITPETSIYDRGRYSFYSDYQPVCHAYPGSHGSVNVARALRVSCNYFFYDVGRQTGITSLTHWAGQLGLGRRTGIELEGESAGYVAGPEAAEALGLGWYGGDVLQASIGQSYNLLTPIQLANYTAALANGGSLYRTHLLKEVKSADSTRVLVEQGAETLWDTGLQPETVAAVQDGMYQVTHGGTGTSAFRGCTVEVAAKTGSVQSDNTPNNAVFVAYAPADKPEIALAIVVEKGGAGSMAAPIARSIIEAYFAIQDEMRNVASENSLQR